MRITSVYGKTIHCEWEDCGNKEYFESPKLIENDEVQQRALSMGWKEIRGMFFCPNCRNRLIRLMHKLSIDLNVLQADDGSTG